MKKVLLRKPPHHLWDGDTRVCTYRPGNEPIMGERFTYFGKASV